ncbi:MAG: HD domain-containing protein [Candidatus Taylorbacteria bacterium]|nr:HD domain-containing protein [Candidatus Taylorbacteria bacterium]
MSKSPKTTLCAHVPPEISNVTSTLEKNGFEAYIIGGCTRDLLLGRKPKDWDVTTNATPEEIIKLFPKTFYENNYGTVGIVNESTEDETLKIVEVTPYRLETGYSDFRRPDSVTFSKNIKDDLARRDFTINAIALRQVGDDKEEIVDLFEGQNDLSEKIIKTVGDANERFGEDALRMMRAVRLHAELGFSIASDTQKAIKDNSKLLEKIAKERVRDELIRIIMSDRPMEAIETLQKLGLLTYIIPELEKAMGIEQNQAHSYDVWEHLLRSLQHAADKKWPLDIRIAALLHDISKPETRRRDETKGEWTFYGHDVVGARVSRKTLERLNFPKKLVDKVTKLIRWHMFFTDTEQITLSAVRRMIVNVSRENIWDLMNLRICDRIGTGRPKEDPYRLRKYKSMIEEALTDPISVGMLKIDGKRIMDVTHVTPGPKVGQILHALLEDVLEDPKRNTTEYLENRAQELIKLPDLELKKIGEEGKDKKDEAEAEKLEEIRKKYWVK